MLRPIPLWGDLIYNLAPGIWNVLYVALTAYGVLRVQLFDLDLKLKFALRQSTVGAAIAGAFFLGSELLEGLVPVEGTILGLLSAGVIVALLKPVQAVAERFAGRIMTGVSDHPSYLEGQKHQVYRAALEGALEDGSISDRERSILDRLRDQLGIDSEIARTLERDTVRLVTGGGFD